MSTTLLLSGADVRALLPAADCIQAVEAAFRRAAQTPVPVGVLETQLERGGFHLKTAALPGKRHYFAAKLNGNFPDNPRLGLPTIQGVVALCDGGDGRLLALLDSAELTRLRTGAATAVAAKYLARPESATVLLFGCGAQAAAQLECLAQVLPLRRLHAHDRVAERAAALARWAADHLGLSAAAVSGAEALQRAGESDVIVTCTPAREWFLARAAVPPGAFVAGVGADAPGKQELEPALLAASKVVADVLEQCCRMGELRHAILTGALTREDVHAELAEVVSGSRPGRESPQEITLFDSTGTALEDVAAAALAYERASGCDRGVRWSRND